MSIDPVDPRLVASSALAPDTSATRRMKPQEAAKAFEGYLAQLMVKEMRRTLPEGGLFSSQAVDMFMDVLDQEIAERIADGSGLGLQASLLDSIEARQGGGPESGRAGASLSLSPEGHRGAGQRLSALAPVKGVITSRFGRRSDPFHGEQRQHAGLDIAAARGTPITAVRPGTVVLAGERSGYGNVVVVDHGDGLTTLYGHCDTLKVRPGDRVRAGQQVGTVGDTGRATGPHLHFEVRQDGEAVDPSSVLRWR